MDIKLKGKNILITAGPTAVAIDKVRVISNIASGETGILLAEKLISKGAQVTLLSGQADICCINKKIRLIRFRFFDELKKAIEKELRNRKFDIIIHSAAVSDFRPVRVNKGKISSGIKSLNIKLVPAEKLVKIFKKTQPKVKLVIFKLELGVSANNLIKRAMAAKKEYKADLVVANTFVKDKYRAFIIDSAGNIFGANNKNGLVKGLIKFLTYNS